MLSSPTSSLSSSASSSTSNSTIQPDPTVAAAHRRRSVDNGGLNLALNDHSGSGSGKGWGGWEPDPTHDFPGPTGYAELVLAMREQTATAISHAHPATQTSSISPSERNVSRRNLIYKLTSWNFDASQLTHSEVLMCACLLFETLFSIEGMGESIGFESESIHPFLARISKIYRAQTSYHNFQHAVDVLQAIHCYLHEAGCVPSVDILLDEENSPNNELDESFPEGGPCTPPRRKMWRRLVPEGKRDTFLRSALRNQDIFVLYVAAVGHDIGHPGLSNKFLSNAKAPLAELFDDVSVLEKFHCTVLLQVMRSHSMVHLLDRMPHRSYGERDPAILSHQRTESDPGVSIPAIAPFTPSEQEAKLDATVSDLLSKSPAPTRSGTSRSASVRPDPSNVFVTGGTGTELRDLLMKSILATDMSVHVKWMPKMAHLLQTVQQWEDAQGEKEVDYETRLLLCQALIKCADISNPSRPPPICKHWSSSLLSEWAEQAMLEKQLALPISVTASEDLIEEAKGQVAFIDMFTKPLLQATSAVIPEMDVFMRQCDANLVMWKAKIQDLEAKNSNDERSDSKLSHAVDDSFTSSPLVLPTSLPDVSTMFALSLPSGLQTSSSDRSQPSWHDSSSSIPGRTRPDNTDSGPDKDNVSTPSQSDSRSSSPPSCITGHRRHTSHAELPHVSIPSAIPTFMSSSNSQHAKSSSTTSFSASPLFSPRSIPTSSSSPRSDISSGSVPSATGLQFRLGLRAAYEANERPRAMKKLENRASWQGSMAGTIVTTTPIEPLPDPSARIPPYISNGS